MGVFETERGKRLTISLPPATWVELTEASETYQRLTGEEKATRTRLDGLRVERERAVERETYEAGQALKANKKPKASTKVEALDKEIAATERHLAGVQSAVESASTDLIDVVDEHREEWDEDALAQLREVQGQYAESVEAAATAAWKVFEKLAVLRWIRFFPDEMLYRVGEPPVASLVAPHGDPYGTAQVFAALREQAQIQWNPKQGRDAHGAAVQAQHEARRANEVAGRRYMTDEERALFEADPFSFFNGPGSSPMRRMASPLVITNGDEAAPDQDDADAEDEG